MLTKKNTWCLVLMLLSVVYTGIFGESEVYFSQSKKAPIMSMI
jgi:hypothetical protein